MNFEFTKTILASDKDRKVEYNLSVIVNVSKEAWKGYVHYLNEHEKSELERQRTEDAKNSYCFGKVAAKTVVAPLVHKSPVQVSVDHGIFGYPVIEPAVPGHQLSLAHTNTSGIAITFPEHHVLGIDMEEIKEANNSIMTSAFTEKETELYPLATDTLLNHILWSAREALSKALRTGFLIALPLLAVKSIEKTDHFYVVKFIHFPLFECAIFQMGKYVIALVHPDKVKIDLGFIDELEHLFSENLK